MTTLHACELTLPLSAERSDRGALVAGGKRAVGTAIGRSLAGASRQGQRDGNRLAARFPCADACASITGRMQAINRRRET